MGNFANWSLWKKLVYSFWLSLLAGLFAFGAYSFGAACGSAQDTNVSPSAVCKMGEPGRTELGLAVFVVLFLLLIILSIYYQKRTPKN